MTGYEEYITNLYQIQYDPDEWNYYVGIGIKYGWVVRAITTAVGFLLLPYKVQVLKKGLRPVKLEGIMRFLAAKNKRRPVVCRRCSYSKVCDSLWKNYITFAGTSELSPLSGKKISDPAWCMLASGFRKPGML